MMKYRVGWVMGVILLLGTTASLAGATETKPSLATAGQKTITIEDLAKHAPDLVSWFGMGIQPQAVHHALEDLILFRLMAREAYANHLHEQPEIKAQLDRLVSAAYLKQHLSPEKLAVSKPEAQTYYDAHPERYQTPSKLRLAHILVPSESDLQTLQAAVQQGEALSKLAAEQSLDPASSHQGGDLGWRLETELIPPLAEAVKALQPGQYQEVQTVFGHHLLWLQETTPPRLKPFESVKKEVYLAVRDEKKETLKRNLKQVLWTKYEVEIHAEPIRRLLQSAGSPATNVVHYRGSADSAQGRLAPRLQPLMPAYDLGSVKAETVTHRSLIANSGTAPLVVRQIRTRCRCITAEVTPTTLAPGEVGTLTLRVDPSQVDAPGRLSDVVHLESNDPVKAHGRIRITTTVAKEGTTRERS